MARIHPSAIVDPKAELADDVVVGPFTQVGPNVRIDAGTQVGSHVVLAGHTSIGRNNRLFPFSALGTEPQDKKYRAEDTRLEIGDGNTIREFCLFNTGTTQGGGVTRVGSNNWIMGYVHLAHDCVLGSNTILANAVQLAGHVEIGDWVVIGGKTGFHQFVRVGQHSMVGGGSIVLQDVPPYIMANGHPAGAHGVHVEGLKRRNYSAETITVLKRAYRMIYRENLPLAEAREALDGYIREQTDEAHAAPLRALAEFLAVPGRGIVR